MLPRQGKIAFEKGNSLGLKTTKGSDPSKGVCATVGGNNDFDVDEEKINFLAKRFSKFFRKNKPSSRSTRRVT